MKKLILALAWSLFPPLSIILTTPAAKLADHTTHILIFFLFGIILGILTMKGNTNNLDKKVYIRGIVPFFATISILTLFSFLSIYAMPCHYIFSPHTTQTLINHPCAQSTIACKASVSFVPHSVKIAKIIPVPPQISVNTTKVIPDDKAPPLA